MTVPEARRWLENIKDDIGSHYNASLWHYEKALDEIIKLLQKPKTDCEYCKYYLPETKGCERNSCVEPWEKDDFCSYAERRRQI